MSTHPNAMMILALTPDDLARRTYHAILAEAGIDQDGSFYIGGEKYHCHGVMESDFDEDIQVGLPEGTIYLMTHVTYGYGVTITWKELEEKKKALEEWGKGVCNRHTCTQDILISANYW